jgi:hypothetical protein
VKNLNQSKGHKIKKQKNGAFNSETIRLYVKLEISLEDQVYLETYYHHTQDDIHVVETPTKI